MEACLKFGCLRYQRVGGWSSKNGVEIVTCFNHEFNGDDEICKNPGDIIRRDPFVAEKLKRAHDESIELRRKRRENGQVAT